MSIKLINEEKEEKTHKSYFLTERVVSAIEEIKEKTKSGDFNEAFEKMIVLTNIHLEAELKNKN